MSPPPQHQPLRKAYVAFDLDNTLGFFQLTNPLAQFWSPNVIGNPEYSAPNPPLQLSHRLQSKLKRARELFVTSLAEDKELLFLVLRPNLDIMIRPLLRLRAQRALGSVVIYSNTSISYSLELAKALIERHYKATNLFGVLADHWHPLRLADHHRTVPHNNVYKEPFKQISTLQLLFEEDTGRPAPSLDQILFVDDRRVKHRLTEVEEWGLTYLQPAFYEQHFTKAQVKRLFALALEAMDRVGLLNDQEYLGSGICHRVIPYNYTKREEIHGFPDLFSWVWGQMSSVKQPKRKWQDDSFPLMAAMNKYLEKLEA